MTMAANDRISIDPAVMVGKPVIKGTRITVEMIVRMVRNGVPVAEIVQAYPHIAPDDIEAARRFAGE